MTSNKQAHRQLRIPGVEDNARGTGAPVLENPQVIKIKKSRTFRLSAARGGRPWPPSASTSTCRSSSTCCSGSRR